MGILFYQFFFLQVKQFKPLLPYVKILKSYINLIRPEKCRDIHEEMCAKTVSLREQDK